MIVVNLFGVPGAGKSTGAAYIFSNLKMRGINAELVTEFAKDMVWENNTEVFKNQAYIFGTQSFRISRCQDKVDVIVTDCPLFLTAFYNKSPILGKQFNDVVFNVFNSYNNVNFFIDRVKDYNPIGRLQTEKEAQALREPMLKMLKDYNVDFTTIDGTFKGYDLIVDEISKKAKENMKNEHSTRNSNAQRKKRDTAYER
ncbi:MAG: hypothetical protein IJN05_10810 [Ruminococcus sp.]|nr:hypothetical protein [Ruminococcus sp.]